MAPDKPTPAWHLRSARNFVAFSILAIGSPAAIFGIIAFGDSVSADSWKVFLVILGLGTGALWGILMWQFFVKAAMQRLKAEARVNE